MSDDEYKFYTTLIDEVRKKKCLYDKKDPFYFIQAKKMDAWKIVALRAQRPINECKDRWKLLRERFCKEVRKMHVSDTKEFDLNKWHFFDEMSFLTNIIVPRRPRGNKLIDETIYDQTSKVEDMMKSEVLSSDEDSDSSSSLPAKKPKTSLESVCSEFADAVKETRVPLNEPLDENSEVDQLFLQNIHVLMKDLPIQVKDKFQSDMYSEIFKVRAEARIKTGRHNGHRE